jgi:hypothetical protein
MSTLTFADLFQGVCWMFYPAENDPAYVNNPPTDEQYSVDWDQIQESYRDISQGDLATGTWPARPCIASSDSDTYHGIFYATD